MFLVLVFWIVELGNMIILFGLIFLFVFFKDFVICFVGFVQKVVEIFMYEKNDIRRFKVIQLIEIILDDIDKEFE